MWSLTPYTGQERHGGHSRRGAMGRGRAAGVQIRRTITIKNKDPARGAWVRIYEAQEPVFGQPGWSVRAANVQRINHALSGVGFLRAKDGVLKDFPYDSFGSLPGTVGRIYWRWAAPGETGSDPAVGLRLLTDGGPADGNLAQNSDRIRTGFTDTVIRGDVTIGGGGVGGAASHSPNARRFANGGRAGGGSPGLGWWPVVSAPLQGNRHFAPTMALPYSYPARVAGGRRRSQVIDPACPVHGTHGVTAGGHGDDAAWESPAMARFGGSEWDPACPVHGVHAGGYPPSPRNAGWAPSAMYPVAATLPGGRLGGGEMIVDPACPLHGRAAGGYDDEAWPPGRRWLQHPMGRLGGGWPAEDGTWGARVGGVVNRRVEVKNRAVGTVYVRVYKIRDAWSCVFSTCPQEALGALSEVYEVPAGKSGTVMVPYEYPLLGPTQVVRVYWRGSRDQLPDSGPAGELRDNNARIRLGISTVDVGTRVTTGGAAAAQTSGYAPRRPVARRSAPPPRRRPPPQRRGPTATRR